MLVRVVGVDMCDVSRLDVEMEVREWRRTSKSEEGCLISMWALGKFYVSLSASSNNEENWVLLC